MSQYPDPAIKTGKSDAPVETLLLQRWSPRSFADKPVSEEDLRSIFSAASRVPITTAIAPCPCVNSWCRLRK